MKNTVSFSTTNAQCRAIKSTLLGKSFFRKALEAETIGDLYRMLKNNLHYSPHLQEMGKKNIENGVKEAFSYLYRRLTRTLGKKEQRIFDLFFNGRKTLTEKKLLLGHDRETQFRKVDLEYMEELKSAVESLGKSDMKGLETIIGSYFDRLNLYTILRLRILYRMEPEEILPFLIPYGLKLNLASLGRAPGFSTLSELSDMMRNSLGISFESYHEFRKELGRYHLRQLQKAWYGYPFKLSILFSLLRLKEIEAENLNILVEGIYYRLPPEEIKTMLTGSG